MNINKSIVILAIMAVIPVLGLSQAALPHETCDTIDIDRCYTVVNGHRIDIDTSIHLSVDGIFEIISHHPLNDGVTMFAVAHTDTIYTIYDSTIVRRKMVYSVDTSLYTQTYYVLVDNEDGLYDTLMQVIRRSQSIDDWDSRRQSSLLPLHVESFYNKVEQPHTDWEHWKEWSDGNDLLLTESCDRCHVIIMNGNRLQTHDCQLYNRLYRLAPDHGRKQKK